MYQPYEDLLPYDEFSVRLPASDIPQIQQVRCARASWVARAAPPATACPPAGSCVSTALRPTVRSRSLQVLEAVSEEEWARLHEAMKVHHRAFVWDQEYGGLAYNYTILSLRRRLHNFLAGVMQEY